MNKIKEEKRSKLIYSDQNCKKKVTPDVQRDLQTKSLTNLAKCYVNGNQSSEPSYGDCDGPNIMTLKQRKLSSDGDALMPGAATNHTTSEAGANLI